MSAAVAPRVGVIFKSYEKLSSIIAYAQRAGELDMGGGLWISEAHQWLRANGGDARGAVTTLAAATMAAKRVPIGLAMASPYLRHPAILASEAAALDELSGGRFAMALGASKLTTSYFEPDLIRKPPLKVHREAISIIRQALKGEQFQFIGSVFAAAMPSIAREHMDHRIDIPVYLCAAGSKLQTLAGEVADGLLLPSLTSPAFAASAIENVRRGMKSAGREPAAFPLGATIICCIGEDGAKARDIVRPYIAAHIVHKIRSSQGDEVLSSADLGPLLNTLRGAILAGHRDIAHLISDEALHKLGVAAGTVDEAAAVIQHLVLAGINLPLIEVVGGSEAVILKGMTHLARDIVPQLTPGPDYLGG